jgi:hypothetical protein
MFPTTNKEIEDSTISPDQLLENISEYTQNGKFDSINSFQF